MVSTKQKQAARRNVSKAGQAGHTIAHLPRENADGARQAGRGRGPAQAGRR
jgi:hypothetical protein